jgi:hypothetical protein
VNAAPSQNITTVTECPRCNVLRYNKSVFTLITECPGCNVLRYNKLIFTLVTSKSSITKN